MKINEALLEKWKVHTWKTSEGEVFYIGPVHGRVSVATYKTRAAAQAALNMRTWLAKEIKKQNKSLAA